MRDRASQQAALAKLGQDALSGADFDALLEEAVQVAARALEADSTSPHAKRIETLLSTRKKP